ncbi:uncharacterized protein BDZ83DRAFT_283252 [Colletotrichum acutatum]|uniref:Uncharacterized protein n=1 Tax=Glomerella acutata TaxID=27357 RepID=A0AAD8UPA2_GLOAC|nr:uncharacterized protein BDZ83DRAFT_283252 [Colletotrichum acutatum]KAK1725795.1 hypothetical protein BDZ83DRAFT_283252 [Colletotrichum acutatum]
MEKRTRGKSRRQVESLIRQEEGRDGLLLPFWPCLMGSGLTQGKNVSSLHTHIVLFPHVLMLGSSPSPTYQEHAAFCRAKSLRNKTFAQGLAIVGATSSRDHAAQILNARTCRRCEAFQTSTGPGISGVSRYETPGLGTSSLRFPCPHVPQLWREFVVCVSFLCNSLAFSRQRFYTGPRGSRSRFRRANSDHARHRSTVDDRVRSNVDMSIA